MVDVHTTSVTRPYRRPTKAIITDAGFASRFLPWTKTNPKAMGANGQQTHYAAGRRGVCRRRHP